MWLYFLSVFAFSCSSRLQNHSPLVYFDFNFHTIFYFISRRKPVVCIITSSLRASNHKMKVEVSNWDWVPLVVIHINTLMLLMNRRSFAFHLYFSKHRKYTHLKSDLKLVTDIVCYKKSEISLLCMSKVR